LSLFDALVVDAKGADAKPALRPRRPRKASPGAAPENGRASILTPPEAALFLSVSVAILKAWRAKNVGPPWRRRGARLVFYRRSDLEHFLDEGAAKR
jgi:hypothetical protein